MTESAIINLIGLLGDVCTIYLFQSLLPIRNKRLFWGIQLAGIVVVRLVRTFVDPTMGWVFLPIALGGPLLLSEGPLIRRAIAVAFGFVLITAAEVPMALLWATLSGEELMSVAAAYGHLPLYISLETMYAFLLIIVSLVVRVPSRRFVGGADVSRTSYVVAAFPLTQAIILVVCMRYISFTVAYHAAVLLVGSLVCLLAIVADFLLMRAVQASADKAVADLAAEAISRAADDYLARYAGLERSIELTSMLRHDIRNQLGVIAELMATGEDGQALALVKALEHEAEEASAVAGPLGRGPEGRGEAPVIPPLRDDATLSSARSFAIARGLFSVSYLSLVLSGIWLISSFQKELVPLFIMGALAIGILLLPALFRMLRDAHDADVAVGRARAAEALLEASQRQGERLAADAAVAEQVLGALSASLAELEDLVHAGDAEGLSSFADEARASAAGRRRWCEHGPANMLVEMKARSAEEAGVEFEAELDLPRDLALPALDVCAVLSNVLDNAIAAAARAPEDRRWVRLATAPRGGYLMVRCENGVAPGAAITHEAHPDRPEPGGHGWGLRILGEFARRHDGEVATSLYDGAFVTQVTLRIDG